MRSGQPYTHVVTFSAPADGVAQLIWSLIDETGGAVTSGTLTPPLNAISANVTITAPYNTLTSPIMWGGRELSWSFVMQVGRHQYELEGYIPFGINPNGVRTKLGLGVGDDLTDEEIPLLKAYLTFRDTVGSTTLAAVTADLSKLIVADAVEAIAALALLPTMQVRVAERESSGTNQYARGKVDWDSLAENLRALVTAGEALVDISLAPSNNGVSLLQLATPDTDLFPGA